MTNANDNPLRSPSQTSDADDRRLWFDYIHALNERQLQESQRSGITTYVLAGALVALVYRFGPHLPQFLTQTGAFRASVTISVLLTVALTNFAMMVGIVGRLLAGGDEFRAVPKSRQALIPFVYGTGVFMILVFAAVESWLAVSTADRFIKCVLVANALFWAFASVSFLVLYGRAAKKAKTLRSLLPHFDLFRQPPTARLIGLVLPLAWLLLATGCLIRYVKSLPGYGLQPFKAASVGLIVLWIVAYLIHRNFSDASRQKHFGLERDIVLNRMTSSEIRERYLCDLSGPDMAQWLDDALARLEAKEKQLEGERDWAQKSVGEIAAIDSGYRVERKTRAKSAAERLDRAIDGYISQCKALTFQTEVFVNSYMTDDEIKALRERFEVLKTRTRTLTERVESSRAVLSDLAKLMEHEP
jgi:hypothetical protein